MSEIQDPLRRELIREIYRHADELRWDCLSISERSAWYNRWVDDNKIGGVLTRYMPRERARLWIKDVPMKHYNRARSGIGPYADLVLNPLPGATQIATLTLGEEWLVVDGSVQEKPNRCLVTDGQATLLMIWGGVRNLQSLIWAGLNARVDGSPTPIVVVTTRQGERLTAGEQARHQQLAKLAGIEIRHLTTRVTHGPVHHDAGV
jgi:hypothetical protein